LTRGARMVSVRRLGAGCRRDPEARNPAGTPLTASSLQPAATAIAGGTATPRSGSEGSP
jgi:hypothetical protein